jgi:Fic family protein
MALLKLLNEVDTLQEEINSYGKLSEETLKKIHYRFRLDWNYHSNAMEGNSLTQQETRSVMINNVTVEGKPLKDVLEIKGHDETISQILKIGMGELRLSEKRIQDIHKAIIHEDDPEQAKKIGKWKTENNHLINYKGEKFEFTPYQEVSEAMHNLINWLNKNYDLIVNKKKEAIHPALLAFRFHVTYVSIHPFYDGNGRTARIFTNLILIALGYPPVIIKVDDKNVYNQYLADIQAYGGSEDLFLEFMCKQLIHSQEIVLKAIKGISIEEPEDLDKKIRLLEKELEAIDPDESVKERFSPEVFLNMYSGWISEMLRKTISVVQKFNKFFTGTEHRISASNNVGSINFVNEPAEELIAKLLKECTQH